MLNSSFSKFMTRTDEKIMDRFIPSKASQRIYRSREIKTRDPHNDQHPIIRDESAFNMNYVSDREGAELLSQSYRERSTPEPQRDTIADALNFHHHNRVFTFTPTHSGNNSSPDHSFNETHNSPNSTSSTNSPIFSSLAMGEFPDVLPSRNSMDSEISIRSYTKQSQQKKKEPKSRSPYRILNAPELRNDFYCNLVSWSKLTGKLAVGMGSEVCLWDESTGHSFLDLPKSQIVSSVAFSDGMSLVVSSHDGYIRLFTQETTCLIDEHVANNKSICCITWVPGSDSKFYAGDEAGEVFYFEIQNGIELRMVKRFTCHQQQICGIAVSNDLKQITVGGNDNSCTIWNVENKLEPTLCFYLPHQAAVKAIAYCPWSNSLLATGGGSKDRTVRFWHASTGTLLSSYKTKGQITSLTWSHTKRQIAITFGFSDNEKPVIITILSYPDLNVITEVATEPGLRALSAVSSPDKSSICIASNDHTVRFYKFWELKDSPILNYEEKGVFGSDIIELSEGVIKHGGSIR